MRLRYVLREIVYSCGFIQSVENVIPYTTGRAYGLE